MALTDAQKFRAGRAILNWTQYDLANRAGMSHTSISNFERTNREMQHNNKMACWRAFADAGVQFGNDIIRFMPNINTPVSTPEVPPPTPKESTHAE